MKRYNESLRKNSNKYFYKKIDMPYVLHDIMHHEELLGHALKMTKFVFSFLSAKYLKKMYPLETLVHYI